MSESDHGARAIVAATLMAACVVAAGAARAARVIDVRIGTHPGYARVVLETDAPADHEVVSAPATAPGEVVVRLAATSDARALPARGAESPAVALEPQPDGSTLARIRASGPVRVETQVLAAPPRVVLDLRPGAVVALEPPVEPPPNEAPAPPPEPVQEPAPQPVAPAPPPTPLAVAPRVAVEPPPPSLPIEIPKPPVVLPPVSTPPPSVLRFDPRSFGVGAALGIGVALVAWAMRRERRHAAVAPEPPAVAPPDPGPAEAVAPIAPEPAAAAEPPLDRPRARADDRLDALEARLAAVAERLAQIEQGGELQAAEIAAQRAAIARLQRALRAAAPPVPPAVRHD